MKVKSRKCSKVAFLIDLIWLFPEIRKKKYMFNIKCSKVVRIFTLNLWTELISMFVETHQEWQKMLILPFITLSKFTED